MTKLLSVLAFLLCVSVHDAFAAEPQEWARGQIGEVLEALDARDADRGEREHAFEWLWDFAGENFDDPCELHEARLAIVLSSVQQGLSRFAVARLKELGEQLPELDCDTWDLSAKSAIVYAWIGFRSSMAGDHKAGDSYFSWARRHATEDRRTRSWVTWWAAMVQPDAAEQVSLFRDVLRTAYIRSDDRLLLAASISGLRIIEDSELRAEMIQHSLEHAESVFDPTMSDVVRCYALHHAIMDTEEKEPHLHQMKVLGASMSDRFAALADEDHAPQEVLALAFVGARVFEADPELAMKLLRAAVEAAPRVFDPGDAQLQAVRLTFVRMQGKLGIEQDIFPDMPDPNGHSVSIGVGVVSSLDPWNQESWGDVSVLLRMVPIEESDSDAI